MNNRRTQKEIEYWLKHRCWKCGVHSQSQKILPMLPKCGGFLCLKCYSDLFGKEPK